MSVVLSDEFPGGTPFHIKPEGDYNSGKCYNSPPDTPWKEYSVGEYITPSRRDALIEHLKSKEPTEARPDLRDKRKRQKKSGA